MLETEVSSLENQVRQIMAKEHIKDVRARVQVSYLSQGDYQV